MPVVEDLSVAVAILAGLLVALEVGFRIGRRTAGADRGGQVGAIEGAILGLLGLLLAFSFAGAGGRFVERQDLVVQEANAIGTAYLRADLLDEPNRSGLRSAVRDYTRHRLELSRRVQAGISPGDAAEMERLQGRMWSAAAAGANAKPASLVAVTSAVNDVIDLHSTRLAAANKRLPMLVLGLLIACSALATGAIGYGCGAGGTRRAPLTVPLTALIGVTLWITIDLDYPRRGLLQIDDAPLQALKFDEDSR
jgi:hypothetical protein